MNTSQVMRKYNQARRKEETECDKNIPTLCDKNIPTLTGLFEL